MKLYVMQTKVDDELFQAQDPIKIHPQMKDFLGFCLYKLALSIRSRLDQKIQHLGVVAPQCAVLRLLEVEGEMTQSELGAHLAIDKASVVRMIDRLEELGLLKRSSDPNDRRAKVLAITHKGTRLLEVVAGARKSAEQEALVSLSREEQKKFRELVAKLML